MVYYQQCMEEYQEDLLKQCANEYAIYPCPSILLTEPPAVSDYFMCPSEMPILCPDGTCVSHFSDCLETEECGYKNIQCPDGTCADSLASCGTLITCPRSRPFLCEDRSCKTNEKDCVAIEHCPKETPYRCPDSSCVETRSLCPTGRVCPPSTPILCDDGQCYPDSPEVCENTSIRDCPQGRIRCWDNSCRVAEALCPERTCPPTLPFMCQNGQCVETEEDCPAVCRDTVLCLLPPQLGEDQPSYNVKCCNGLSRDECCGFPQTAEVCPENTVRCGDGVCRAASDCVNGSSCPADYPYRCSNNECVEDPVKCITQTKCGDGWVKCPTGLCAPSYGDCKLPLTRYPTYCPEGLPVVCADKTCVRTLDEVGN